MRQFAFALSFVCGLVTFRDAFAQSFFYVPPGGYGYGIDLGIGFGYGYGFGYGLADSPDTLAANALTDFARYQGHSQVVPPRTMIDSELLNDEVTANWRSVTAENQAKQRASKLLRAQAAKEAMAKHREQQNSHPELHLPARLTREQFDPSTGKITWPSGLLRDTFSLQRSEVEALLKTRARTESSIELNASTARRIQEMVQELRSQIHMIRTMEYLEGQRFLTRLDREVR